MDQRNGKRYLELAEKWLNGTLSEEEREEYNAWYNSDTEAPLNIDAGFASSPQDIKNRIFHRITAATGIVRKRRRAALLITTAAAAVLFILFYLGNYWSQPDREKDIVVAAGQPAASGDILPGKNHAVLTLSNGIQVNPTDSAGGILAIDGNARILKRADGSIIYHEESQAPTEVSLTNTMTTPRGAFYQLTLPDGTAVWLNAASSITFPLKFGTNERRVSITGEVYFEVASNKKRPFIVTANSTQVTVLGTHFNINAYNDENAVRTTLIEGQVKVSSNINGQEKMIMPGQQSQTDRSGAIRVGNVNIDEVISWKNGVFRFNKTEITSLMRQISRWYNVDVRFEGSPPKDLFSGTIPKSLKLAELLTVLKTANVKFEIQGNELTVKSR